MNNTLGSSGELPEQPTLNSEKREINIDPAKLDIYMQSLKQEQNFPIGFLTGLIVAGIGAGIWAFLTVKTGYQIGFMAIALGFVIGLTVRFFGKGLDTAFGILGAVLSLAACLMGNLFTIIGLAAEEESMPVLGILSLIDYNLIPVLMKESFQMIDLVFYGIAAYAGYHFSFRLITEDDIFENASANLPPKEGRST